MSTPVTVVYDVFLKQIGKDILLELDDDIVEDFMLSALNESIMLFDECEKDLTINEDEEFVSELTTQEIHILAKGMLLFWLQNKINTEEITKNIITDGDYTTKSAGNLLNNLLKSKEMQRKEFYRMKRRYSYRGNNINE